MAAQRADRNSAPAVPVVLCASDAELYVLVRLGISCTPIGGVERLNGKQVFALFKHRPKRAEERLHQLVLLGWQPETIRDEPSQTNLAAIRHVAAIRSTYGHDPHTVFSVWLPNAAELRRIRRAHSFVDGAHVADEFRSSLAHSVYAPADALCCLLIASRPRGRRPAPR